MSPFVEPFRIRAVEPIRVMSRNERLAGLERTHYNLTRLAPGDVAIDLQTDSVSPVRVDVENHPSSVAWSEIAPSEIELFVHQGRSLDRILSSVLVASGDIVADNGAGERWRANVSYAGAECRTVVYPDAFDPASDFAFKGNVDVERLERLLDEDGARVKGVVLTSLSPQTGWQPFSLENLRSVSGQCRSHNVPLWLDATRLEETIWMQRRLERGLGQREGHDIAREVLHLVDGAWWRSRSSVDGPGRLVVQDGDFGQRLRELVNLTDGRPPQSVRLSGLDWAFDDSSLSARHRVCSDMAEQLLALAVPLARPVGVHGLCLDAGRFLPHLAAHELPAQALACALYVDGGIRAGELGSLALGGRDAVTGDPRPAPVELVRVCLPTATYTASHFAHVIDVLAAILRRRGEVRGLRIIREPQHLRTLLADLEPAD